MDNDRRKELEVVVLKLESLFSCLYEPSVYVVPPALSGTDASCSAWPAAWRHKGQCSCKAAHHSRSGGRSDLRVSFCGQSIIVHLKPTALKGMLHLIPAPLRAVEAISSCFQDSYGVSRGNRSMGSSGMPGKHVDHQFAEALLGSSEGP